MVVVAGREPKPPQLDQKTSESYEADDAYDHEDDAYSAEIDPGLVEPRGRKHPRGPPIRRAALKGESGAADIAQVARRVWRPLLLVATRWCSVQTHARTRHPA